MLELPVMSPVVFALAFALARLLPRLLPFRLPDVFAFDMLEVCISALLLF
jgi:hypothetical protein